MLERERKLEVHDDRQLPDLAGSAGVFSVVDGGERELTATYFDTADLALVRAGITVRRRVGGDDEGWHLKLPTGKDRFELDLPLSRAQHMVPKDFRESLRSVTGDHDVRPCCEIATVRHRYLLLDEAEVVLAEVVDDRVRSRRLDLEGDAAEPRSWREWEVEQRHGDEAVLDELTTRLTAAGGSPTLRRSKLARALDEEVPAGPRGPSGHAKKASAATVLAAVLAGLGEEFRLRDVAVRHDLPDAVHQMRVTVRRLRSLLATYRPLLDRGVSEPLRAELTWLGDLLGEPRDAEVVRDLVLDTLEELPPELVRGDVGSRVRRAFDEEHAAAYDVLASAMRSDRYWRLHASLTDVAAEPPWRGKAAEQARRVLPRRVAREWRRVEKRMSAVEALDPADPGDQVERRRRLHEARKSAKRLRYAAEVAEPVAGKDARRLVKAAKRFQSLVGELNDTTVVRQRLLDLADGSSATPGAAFTLGALQGHVQRQGEELVAKVPATWQRLARPRLRRWLE